MTDKLDNSVQRESTPDDFALCLCNFWWKLTVDRFQIAAIVLPAIDAISR